MFARVLLQTIIAHELCAQHAENLKLNEENCTTGDIALIASDFISDGVKM